MLLLAAASTARADVEIAVDPPPPPPPPPSPPAPPTIATATPTRHAPDWLPLRSIGARMVISDVLLRGRDRTVLGFQLPISVALTRRVRVLAEYELMGILHRDEMQPAEAGGVGHVARAGVRVLVADKQVRHDGRFYADLQATAGIARIHDGELGSLWQRDAIVAGRLGVEMWLGKPQPASRALDGYVLLGARIDDDVGVTFASGLEWGF
ncbi:MAG TPA: hypothetical protein VFQ53_35910 [Kofleriaceae bacterium]|nr:hypothetical protein [Kofleriaceae bacterium]